MNDKLYQLAVTLARKAQRTGVPYDDLLSAAHLGLTLALSTFDPSRGAALATWVQWKVRGQLQQAVREWRQYQRHNVPVDFTDRPRGPVGKATQRAVEARSVAPGSRSARIREAVEALPAADRAVIRLRYGIGHEGRLLPWQISRELGMTRRSVHYHLAKGKAALREALREVENV